MLTTVEVTNKLAFVDRNDQLECVSVCEDFPDVTIEHDTATCKMFQIVGGRVANLTIMRGGKAIIEGGVVKQTTVQDQGELLVLSQFIADEVVVECRGRLGIMWTALYQMQHTIKLRPGAFVLCGGISIQVHETDTMENILEFFKPQQQANRTN